MSELRGMILQGIADFAILFFGVTIATATIITVKGIGELAVKIYRSLTLPHSPECCPVCGEPVMRIEGKPYCYGCCSQVKPSD